MNMNEPQGWFSALHSPEAFCDILHATEAVEVTAQASGRLPDRSRMAIENAVFERYVAWDSRAMREHGVCLDESERLDALIDAGCKAECDRAACFVLKCVDCRGSKGAPERVVLTVTSFGGNAGGRWLVHH